MKDKIKFCLLALFIFSAPVELGAQQEMFLGQSQVTVSMDFQDARLKDILKILSIQSGLNFIASEGVQDRTVTLYLDNVPIQEAMDKIFKANNLSYDLDDDTNIFIVKDWGKPSVETATRIYNLKYRSVPGSQLEKEKSNLMTAEGKEGAGGATADIMVALKQVMSADGKITDDPRTNSLVITDVPGRFEAIEKVIVALDIPQQQIMLDVEILDVSKNVVDKLGFEFGDSPFTLTALNKEGIKYFFGELALRGQELAALTATQGGSIIMGRYYAQILDFLRTRTDTKYLARPRILTLNNETAEIAITKDEVVGFEKTVTDTSSGLATNTKFIRSTDLVLTKEGTGIFLRVTPQINPETAEITMVLNPKSSVTSPSTLNTDNTDISSQADAEVRSTKSVVKIRDGETVILGGLIHNDKNVVTKKIPILGDIPFIGLFFRGKNQSKDVDRELIVFITPHIVKDKASSTAYAKKSILPEREQDMTFAADRQSEINKSLDNMERSW